MRKIFIVLLVLLPAIVFASDWKSENIKDFSFMWRFEGSNLEVKVSYPGTGWVAVGFGAENKMKGANIIIGSVDDGVLTIEDHYGNSPISHKEDTRLDGTDDIISSSGTESDGVTSIEFTIPVSSGDQNDKPLVEGNVYRVIFAASNSDNLGRIHRTATGKDIKL